MLFRSPAYTPISAPVHSGAVPEVDETGGNQETTDGDGLSIEAQRAETTLSGTTLRGQASSGRAPTTLAGDVDGSQVGSGRNDRGYHADRKI